MLRLRALLLFSALAACDERGSELCASHEETYRVTARVKLRDADKARAVGPVETGRVLASVVESRSIVSCRDGVASQMEPGRALVSRVPVDLDAAGFTLRVAATLYPKLDVPELQMRVLFDENANGRCDDGEPTGGAVIERRAQSNVSIDLVRGGCPVAL